MEMILKRALLFLLLSGIVFSSCEKNKGDVVEDVCTIMDDINFMRYCYDSFDVNHDHVVSMEEAGAVKNIDVSSRKIVSLQGIEYFPNLIKLDCSNNQLTFLDVSKNEELVTLDCSRNPSLTVIWYGDKISLLDLVYDPQNITSIINKGRVSIEGRWGLIKESRTTIYEDGNRGSYRDYADDYDPSDPEYAMILDISKQNGGDYTFSPINFWVWDMEDYVGSFPIKLNEGKFTGSTDASSFNFFGEGTFLVTSEMLSLGSLEYLDYVGYRPAEWEYTHLVFSKL